MKIEDLFFKGHNCKKYLTFPVDITKTKEGRFLEISSVQIPKILQTKK